MKSNLRFVVSVAKQYEGLGLPITDLISSGNEGLMEAAERFDDRRGFKFISYAVWWIRQRMILVLSESSRTIRLPQNQITRIRKALRVQEKLEQDHDRLPTNEEIALELGRSVESVAETLRVDQRMLSLEEPLKKDGSSSLLDVVGDKDRSARPDLEILTQGMKDEITSILSSLDEKEAQILRLYFGLSCDRPHTLEEIGHELKLTGERVRQLKEKAIRRLRLSKKGIALKHYLG